MNHVGKATSPSRDIFRTTIDVWYARWLYIIPKGGIAELSMRSSAPGFLDLWPVSKQSMGLRLMAHQLLWL